MHSEGERNPCSPRAVPRGRRENQQLEQEWLTGAINGRTWPGFCRWRSAGKPCTGRQHTVAQGGEEKRMRHVRRGLPMGRPGGETTGHTARGGR